MPSLTQLLNTHENLVILDTASTKIQVGLLARNQPALWSKTDQDSGTGLFSCLEEVLREGRLALNSIDAFLFCTGPGSMLGIRTVAMALRTWQALRPRPAYAYQSLTLAGLYEWGQKPGREFTVVADARRDTWYAQQVQAGGTVAELRRVALPDLPTGDRVTPENFRAWATLPQPAEVCSYDLVKILPAIAEQDLFKIAVAPDAFQSEAPVYKKWSAQIHRATSAGSP